MILPAPVFFLNIFVVVVQSLSSVLTLWSPWTAAHQASLSFTKIHPCLCPLSRWCHPAISSSAIPFSSHLQSFPESGFFQESALCIRWPKYWSFGFSISPSNEYSGLISFRIDWFDLLAVQGALKSLLQHHSSKALILWCSGLFMVQLSHPYMTTGKTIALTMFDWVFKTQMLDPAQRFWLSGSGVTGENWQF